MSLISKGNHFAKITVASKTLLVSFKTAYRISNRKKIIVWRKLSVTCCYWYCWNNVWCIMC